MIQNIKIMLIIYIYIINEKLHKSRLGNLGFRSTHIVLKKNIYRSIFCLSSHMRGLWVVTREWPTGFLKTDGELRA